MTKRGNIKIGTVVKGLPTILSTIHVTKPYKIDNNFELDEDFNQNQKSLKFKLPYANIENFDNNFKILTSAFIKIKNFKYILNKEEDNVVAYPLDVLKNSTKKLPIIKLGLYKDWSEKLEFQTKGILECILIKSNTENGDIETASGDSFLFKTSSDNSKIEIKEVLDIIKESVPADAIRFLNLKLELHTKLFKKGQLNEVTYARIELPTDKDILLAKKMADTFGKENLEILNKFENSKIKIKNENAILSVEEFEKEYGSFTIEADSEDEQEFLNFSNNGAEEINKAQSLTEKVEEFIKTLENNTLSVNIIKSMFDKYGEEKAKEIINENNFQSNMEAVTYMGNN